MSEHDVQKLDAIMDSIHDEPRGGGRGGVMAYHDNDSEFVLEIARLEAEIARLREERRIVAWGVQFPDGQVIPWERREDAEEKLKKGNTTIALAGGPEDAFRLVALSIEPLPPGEETQEVGSE